MIEPHRLARRARWLGFSLGVVLLAAACAPTVPAQPTPKDGAEPAQQPEPAPAERTRITLAYTTDISSMHPYGNSVGTEYARWSNVYDTLSRFDPERVEFVPLLAESWSNPDPNTWRIELKQGVTFHNGDPFTADDVLFSFDRVANDPQSLQTSKVANIASVEKLDDFTVDIKTNTPDSALMTVLYNFSILNKKLHDELGSEAADRLAIGTGPYMFREWIQGERLVFERNPNYHGDVQPVIDEAVYRVIPESEGRVTALLNGEVDVIAIVPPQHVDRINASGVAEVRGQLLNRPEFIAFNHSYEPWQDNLLLRQAVAHAIDREAVADFILEGHGRALYTPLGPGMIGYDPDLEARYKDRYSYDPDRARELVIEAGFPDGLDVEIGCPVNRFVKDREICEAYGSMLNEVGIRATLHTPEYNTLLATVNDGQVPFYMFGRGSVVDPSDYLHQYFMPGSSKRLELDHPRIVDLLNQEKASFDPEERHNVLVELQEAIMEELGIVPTYQSNNNWGVANRVDWDARADEYMLPAEMSLK